MPYNGVCLTDEILAAIPASGDVHAAVRNVKTNAKEKRAQAAVEERYGKLSDVSLSKRIDEMHTSVEGRDSVPALLGRLEKERSRRRAIPISSPTKVDQAIAMLEEAWSLAEKEHPPDLRRASYLVHVVNSWLQKAAPASRYDECFSGFSKTAAMQSVGMAKGNVRDLEIKFRLGAGIGGWWPATINSLKAARELVQIMSGEKRIEETTFNAVSETINTTSVATPLIGAAIMALPAVIVAVPEIPALPAIIGGVNTAVWGQTLFGAMLSASYLNHVVARSKEAAAAPGRSNPFSIAAAAMVDAPGLGQVVEAATNQSILNGEDLHHSLAERAVGAITGTVETVMNFFGVKDFLGGSPAFEPPPRVAARPNEPTPVTSAAPVADVGESTTAIARITPKPTPTRATQPMRRTNAPRPTISSTLRTNIAAKRPNPQVEHIRSSDAFSKDAAASATPDTPAPTTRTPRVPAEPPRLIGQNATPSGDTAGTGGIREIRANLSADGTLSVEINGDLRQPIPRRTAPNFNRTVPSGNDIGLTDYEAAHNWGPGFGDEARDGMMYAPRDVNQLFQNQDIESRLRELFRLAEQEGATIHVSVKTTSHPLNTWRGHHMLKDASYHFEVSFPDGPSVTIGEVDIHVPPPTARGTASGTATVGVTGGSNGTWSLK